MTQALLIPIPTLVTAAWLKSLPVLQGYVASVDITQGLKPAATWVHEYAITTTLVSARSAVGAPLRTPVVQVDVYGRPVSTGGGKKLPFNTCSAIAELIAEQTYDPTNLGIVNIGGPQIMTAKVGDVSLVRAPSILDRSESSILARASLDIMINYIPVSEEL